ncbi:MAG: hypothetical protein ACD_39C00873G0001, partial [uncultured bacterium]
ITPIISSACITGIAALLLIAGLLTACRGATQAASSPDSSQILQTTEATLAGTSLKIWLARTYEEKAKGLMFFESMQKDEGMLFVYDSPRIMSFWMKNTRIPLDLVFFSDNLEINGWIKNMQPGYGLPERNLPSYVSELPAQYALELNAGSIDSLKLKLGDRLEIPLTLLYSD